MPLRFITWATIGILIAHPAPAQEKTPQAVSCDVRQTVEPILALIEERLKLAEDVARYKWNVHGKIEDPAREQAIINSLGQQATRQGLPLSWAERFFRAQIDASKTVQRALFTEWQQTQTARFDNVPDLTGTTRPKLDELTVKLIAALAAASPQLNRCGDQIGGLSQQKLKTTAGFLSGAYSTAIAPLLEFNRQSTGR